MGPSLNLPRLEDWEDRFFSTFLFLQPPRSFDSGPELLPEPIAFVLRVFVCCFEVFLLKTNSFMALSAFFSLCGLLGRKRTKSGTSLSTV